MKTKSSKISSRSLVELACAELKDRIMKGKYKEGERLVIDQLARQFGTSLIPVREALAYLCANKLIIFERNKGYRVAPPPTPEEMHHLFQARLMIELGSVEGAVANVSPKIIKELSNLNESMESHDNISDPEEMRDFSSLNQQFHEKLIGLTKNEFIIDAYERLDYHQHILRPSVARREFVNVVQSVEEHAAIIEAISARNVRQAREAVRAHVTSSFERLNQAALPAPVEVNS